MRHELLAAVIRSTMNLCVEHAGDSLPHSRRITRDDSDDSTHGPLLALGGGNIA
jgi:hypothetical protein